MKIDLILAAIIAAVPWVSMNSATEATRLALLAGVSAVAALMGYSRWIDARVVQAGVGLTMLALGWLESFPAGNHSAEIGTYIACGAAVLSLASFRAARRSHEVPA
jgi:hypothetical protein